MNNTKSYRSAWFSPFRIFSFAYFALLAGAILFIAFFARDRFVAKSIFNITQQNGSAVDAGLLELALPGMIDAQSQDSQIAISFISSSDLLLEIEEKFSLIEHYSEPDTDIVFRMEEDSKLEDRLDYYRQRISAHFSTETGLTEISVEAFEPQKAKNVADYLLAKTEGYINEINQEVASRQLDFLELEVEKASDRLEKATDDFTALQNKYNLVTPELSISSTLSIIQALRLQLIEKKVKLSTVLRDSPDSPMIEAIESQIQSLDIQIQVEESLLSGPEKEKLNQLASEFEKAVYRLEFRRRIFSGAELMLEKTRTEATVNTRFFSVIQRPFTPEKATQPRRWYSGITIGVLGILLHQIVRIIYLSVTERN